MIEQRKAIDFLVSLAAGTINILGVQMMLVLPIHLFDMAFLNYGIWPAMTLWKGALILIFGIVLAIIGKEVYQDTKNPFDEQMGVRIGSA